MSETEPSEEARRWLRYGREDLAAADALVEQPGIAPRLVCWLSQQAVEKALKAILVYLGIDFPRTHDLDALRNLVPGDWNVRTRHPDLADLTEWAVEARYPGDWPEATRLDALEAAQRAREVWNTIGADLADHGLEVVDAPDDTSGS